MQCLSAIEIEREYEWEFVCVCVCEREREREREREGHLVFKLKTSVVESGQLWSFADKQFCQDQQGISCLTLVRRETEISGLAIRHGRCRFKKIVAFKFQGCE